MRLMDFEFTGPVVEWRGPAPYYFVDVPEDESDDIREAARTVVYWGQVPVRCRIGETEFTTAMYPRDGRYLLPLKDVVRTAEGIGLGDVVEVALSIGR